MNLSDKLKITKRGTERIGSEDCDIYELTSERRNLFLESLDDLTADFVGDGGDGTFEDVGEFHDDGFDFERADAVAGGLDDVVDASDVPEVTVFVTPCGVAGVVVAVVPCFLRRFFVAEVTLE